MPARIGDEEILRPKRTGQSLLDIMWGDLIACIDTLMDSQDLVIDDPELNRLKGRAEGVAWCIAVLSQSPRPIDVNLIKAEAMERWNETVEA